MKKIVTILVILAVSLSLSFPIQAADGSGTCSVSTVPTYIYSETTGNQLTFIFTAAESMNSGAISITAPTGWSAPKGTSGTAGYTTASSAGILGKVANNMDSITTPPWSSSASTTVALETTNIKEGSGSINIHFLASAIAGEIAYATTSAQDWSNYTRVGIWVYSSSTQAADGDLQFGIASTTDFSNASFVNIATSSADTWVYHVLDISGVPASTLGSVQSYGIKYAVDYFGASAGDIFIDEMLIGPDNVAALSFSGQEMKARILELATSSTVTITYGAGGGSSGATAPFTSTDQKYTFTTKSMTAAGGTLTAIASSPEVWVYVLRPLVDNTPPSTTLKAPLAGETITAGIDYTIKGTSIDRGGSTVEKVEVSLDGGVTWNTAVSVASVDSGFSWKYLWVNPVVGDYTIKVRATDWIGNTETPVVIKVNVAAPVVPPEEVVPPKEEVIPPPEEVAPPVEKPITEMTAEELKAKIVEIQQKIIELLNQLIQLIQSQITELQAKLIP